MPRHAVALQSRNGILRVIGGNENPGGVTVSDVWSLAVD